MPPRTLTTRQLAHLHRLGEGVRNATAERTPAIETAAAAARVYHDGGATYPELAKALGVTLVDLRDWLDTTTPKTRSFTSADAHARRPSRSAEWLVVVRSPGIEAGGSSVRNVARINPLVSRFDDGCVVQPTEVIGLKIGTTESGKLLLGLLMEYVCQEFAKHNVCGKVPDIVRLWIRLWPMAYRLVTDFHDGLPIRIEDPDKLLSLVFYMYADLTYGPGSAG